MRYSPAPDAITAEFLESLVADRQITVINNRLTICVVVLKSGFMVTGESYHYSDAADINEELGAQVAYQKAMEKLVQMEAFLRAEMREHFVEKAKANFEEFHGRPWDPLFPEDLRSWVAGAREDMCPQPPDPQLILPI